MKSISERVSQLTLRDLAVVVLCAILVYLLRAKDSYLLKPHWRVVLKADNYQNGKYPLTDEHLPLPIITDIESDGVNEVIIITNDLSLGILGVPNKNHTQEEGVLPEMIVRRKVKLPCNYTHGRNRSWPVAMATGYFVPYQGMVQIRKQRIVIVTDDWTVLCYNSLLHLMWKVQLMDVSQAMENYYVKAMDILVTSQSLHKEDEGLVIIGGSFGHKHHQKTPPKPGDRSRDLGADHPAVKARKKGQSHQHMKDEDKLTHFSTFALSGNNGTIRWHHLPGDFGEQRTSDKDIFDAHHWKLALKKGHLHAGEEPWTKYQHDLNKQLPHTWISREDTKLTLANMKKLKTSPEPKKDSLSHVIGIALDDKHIMGYAYGGMRPHSPHEHVKNPNTVVIHSHNGIEVLSLISGQPITKLRLPEEKGIYADVNEDGGIEEVKATFHHADEALHGCLGIVMSVLPVREMLFTGPLCEYPGWFGGWSLTTLFIPNPDVEEDLRLTVSPVIVKSMSKRSGIFEHLMGHGLPSMKKGYDSIFLTSGGRITSYGPMGEFNWQNVVPTIGWKDLTFAVSSNLYRGIRSADVYNNVFKPSMKPMAIKVFGKEDAVIIAGWRSVAMVDLVDGRTLAEHSIPCQPQETVVTGDFTNDGLTDVLIVCPKGYIGLALAHDPNYLQTVMVGAAVVMSIVVLSWCLTIDRHGDDDLDD